MEQIHFALLAGRKNFEFTQRQIDSIQSKYVGAFIQVFWPLNNKITERPSFSTPNPDRISIVDSHGMTLAKIRNCTINYAKAENCKYVVMIEDDIEILDAEIINKYFDLMSTYEIGIAFYPFGGDSNRVFNIPNYNVSIVKRSSTLEIPQICTASKPASQFMVLDLSKSIANFDEELLCFEVRDFLIRNKNVGIIPFLGMFLDFPDSHKYFKSHRFPRVRNINLEIVKAEQEKLVKQNRWEWKTETHVSNLLKFCAKKLSLVCKL